MFKNYRVALLACALIMVFVVSAAAQDRGEVVVISGNPPAFNKNEVVLKLNDFVRFDNTAAQGVQVLNDITPPNQPSKTPTAGGDIIPSSGTKTYNFTFPNDVGKWRFLVQNQTRDYVDTLWVICPPGVPSMTNWGLIILIAMILAATVWVVYRRRARATT